MKSGSGERHPALAVRRGFFISYVGGRPRPRATPREAEANAAAGRTLNWAAAEESCLWARGAATGS
jgi:hypothetical protein